MQDNSSDYIFKAYITNTAAYDSGERDNAGTWLYFPANAEEITAAFTEIGLPISATPDMYFFDDYVSNVPGLRLALPMYAHVDDLAMLAHKPLNPEEMTAFVKRSNEIMMLLTK